MRLALVTRKDRGFRARAVDALRAEPAPEVRSVAAYGVAATSSDASRADDIAVLLGVLGDDGEASAVRGAAYDALLILHRKPDFPTKRRGFDAARDVDWAWARSLRPRG